MRRCVGTPRRRGQPLAGQQPQEVGLSTRRPTTAGMEPSTCLSVQDPSFSRGCSGRMPDPCRTSDLRTASGVPQSHPSCLASLYVSWTLAMSHA